MIREPHAGRRIIIGRIVGVYGVQGWVKIHSYTRPQQGAFEYHQWLVGRPGQWQPVELADWRRHGKGWLAKIKGVAERDQARARVGCDIAIPRASLPPLPAGEYYWADLIGLRVQTLEGVDLGRVSRLLETGGNDVLVVVGDRERLIPFVLGRDVLTVDLDAALIRVDWDPQF
ncbi:MAG: ribosome maturation factor RimM [Nitrococcus mobilis]|nr:ribosome maturation factor RimM [Nitrococcus mobilis]